MHKSKEEVRSEFGLIFVTLIWGLGFPITQLAIDDGFETFTILAFRFIIGSVILALIFHKKIMLMHKKIVIAGFITSIFLFLGFFFQTKGLVYTSASNNAFLTQTCVIMTPFISWFCFKKRPSIYTFISAFVAVIGIFILVGGFNISSFNIGDLLTLLCAVCVSFHLLTMQYYLDKYNYDTILYTLIQFVFVSVFCVVSSMFLETMPPITNYVATLWPLAFIGIFNTAMGFTIQTYAVKFLNGSRTSIIVSMEALVGSIAAVFILGEHLTINMLLGGILIIIALIISETKLNFIFRK